MFTLVVSSAALFASNIIFNPASEQQTTPQNALLLVANKQEASLSLIEVSTGALLARIPTGAGPHEVAVAASGRQAIVTNYGTGPAPGSSLTVVDLISRQTRTIELGEYRRPHGVWYLPGDTLVAVTVEANQAVIVINVATGTVVRAHNTAQAGSHMVAVTQRGDRAYTANVGSGTITEIDLASGAIRSLGIAPATEGVGVTPDGRQVWVGSNAQHTVTIVDVASWQPIATLNAPGLPYRVNFSPDGKKAIVTTPMANAVRVYDVATRAELGVVNIPSNGAPQGAQPVGATISADSRWAYITCQGSQSAAVLDLETLTLVKTLTTGLGPDGVAVTRMPPAAIG